MVGLYPAASPITSAVISVLFVSAGHEEALYFDRVGQEIIGRGHRFTQVLGRPRSISGGNLVCPSVGFDQMLHSEPHTTFAQLEQGCPSLRSDITRLIFCDPEFRGLSYLVDGTNSSLGTFDQKVRHVQRALCAWNDLLQERAINMVITTDGSELVRHSAQVVSRILALPFRVEFVGPFRNRTFLMPTFDFAPLQDPDVAASSPNLDEGRRMVCDYRASGGGLTLRLEPAHSPSGAVFLRALRSRNRPLRSRTAVVYDVGRRHSLRMLVRKIRRRSAGRLYERLDGAPAVFLPLHATGDAQIVVRAWPFENQLELARHVARSVPSSHRLVVKEHPAAQGSTPLQALRRLRRLGNVKLVSPSVPAWDVIAASDAVVVVNSTTGFEALMAGGSVVVLGRTFYSHVGLTTDVSDLHSLPSAISGAIASPPIEDEALATFMARLWAASMNYAHHRFDASEANIKRTATAILAQ